MVAIMQAFATPCSAFPKDASDLAASISACRSSISALESSIKTTEGSSGGWETFAWVCSVVVAIGVAAEIVGIVGGYRDDLKDWRRGIIRVPDRPSFIRFFGFEVLATVLVVAGVFGEAWASKELSFINSQLRSKTSELRADSDQLLALVTQEAGDASTNAEKAQARANGAEISARKANGSSLLAEQHATAIGNELTKEIDRESAAEHALEDEKVKRLKLAVSLRDREMFDQSGMIARLSSISPRRVLFVYSNDSEPRQFAEQIAVVFSELHWPFFGRRVDSDTLFAGVSVSCGVKGMGSHIEELEQCKALADTLKGVFSDFGIERAEGLPVEVLRVTAATLIIGVGAKPNIELEQALRELGTPQATVVSGSRWRGGGNRTPIPPEPK